ncbi:hypothetical protein M422DRAFT_277080 [Sphaerobolus stellatus SS14]|uniref:Uncharacterized protein n=1 Tax=Sphaerobolus stellatus (strain SS14) TaxID=990650 RepID=A0A0C9U0K3_SPHS4|nr:hypothetical protein M422DRAFT_277080 [Sphaerobolus stellatus SS14]
MLPDALQEPLASSELPEKAKLRLPSDFDIENHECLGLTTLAETEFLLCMGQANDALKQLRETLSLKSFLVRHNKRDTIGQIAKRRSEMEIDWTDRCVKKWAEVYQRAFEAMGRLRKAGEDVNHGGQFRTLLSEDLIMLSAWMEEHCTWRDKGEMAEARVA